MTTNPSPAGPDADAVRVQDVPSPIETAVSRVSADDLVAADAENLNRIRAINDRQKLAAIEVSEVINSYIWLHKRYREAAAARDALAGEVKALREENERLRTWATELAATAGVCPHCGDDGPDHTGCGPIPAAENGANK